MTQLDISETLRLEIVAGHNPHIAIDRADGGRVRIEPHELRGLVAGLVKAAGELAEAAIRGK